MQRLPYYAFKSRVIERQDMRRSFDALALAVKERLELDPESGPPAQDAPRW